MSTLTPHGACLQWQPGLIWLFEELLDPSCRAGLPEAADDAGLSLSLSGFAMSGDFLPIAEPPQSGRICKSCARAQA